MDHDQRFGKNPASRRGQHAGPSGPATTSARPPSSSPPTTRSGRPTSRPGEYRNITGQPGPRLGLLAAAQLAGLPLFLGSYPITPASDILHELSQHKNFGVRTFQAEDEIAGVGSALGASFGGSLGITTTSGPGLDLKTEAIGLAVILELPLIIVDVQRGGPSTGLPTKTEQADLLHAMYGRHGEAPVPIVAPQDAGDCFEAAFEAVRIAVKYRTPVIMLSDGYLANGAEPWRLPDLDAAAGHRVPTSPVSPTTCRRRFAGLPSLPARPRDARPAVGASRGTRASSTASAAWRRQTPPATSPTTRRTTRRWSSARPPRSPASPRTIPDIEVDDEDGAELLVLGWGSTYGAITAGVRRIRARGLTVAQAHLRTSTRSRSTWATSSARYPKVLVPEINLGQLSRMIRAEFLVDAQS